MSDFDPKYAAERDFWMPRKEAADTIAEALSNPVVKKELLRLTAEVTRLQAEHSALLAKLNTPELNDFDEGMRLEAAHQRERWGSEHDAGKAPEDWFWLLGYLAGKALHAAKHGDIDKALHHTISAAAALRNWHAAILGVSTAMRPGIDPGARGIE